MKDDPTFIHKILLKPYQLEGHDRTGPLKECFLLAYARICYIFSVDMDGALKFEYEYEYRSQIGNICELYCEVPKVKNYENNFETFDFFLQLKGELHNLKKQQAYPAMVELKLLEYSHLSPNDIHEKQAVICFFEDLACFDQLQQLVNNYKKCHFEYEYEESMELAENIKFKQYHIENQVHALIKLSDKNCLQFNRDAQIKNVQVVFLISEYYLGD